MENITINKYPEIVRQVNLIKKFASDMGIGWFDEYYSFDAIHLHDNNQGRPCYMIALEDTADNEGNPYSWAWFLDTGEKMA